MNDLELLEQHASRLHAQLEALDARIGADARAQDRQRRELLDLEKRLANLPDEIQRARGAAETGALEAARLSGELQTSQQQAATARDWATRLDDELEAVPEMIAGCRRLLESIGLKSAESIRQRQRVAEELKAVLERHDELTAQAEAAEQARLDALVKGQ